MVRMSTYPGVAYGVLSEGAVLASGSGIIGVEDPRKVTADTLFQLCSVTKPMTAAVALGLVDAGLIALDNPVAAYLPELALADADTRDRLTLRHLLAHTSGLAGKWHGDLAEPEHLTDRFDQPISFETTVAAQALIDYYTDHALAVFDLMAIDQSTARAPVYETNPAP